MLYSSHPGSGSAKCPLRPTLADALFHAHESRTAVSVSSEHSSDPFATLPQFKLRTSVRARLRPSVYLLGGNRYLRDFEEEGLIARGSFGDVYRTRHRLDGTR